MKWLIRKLKLTNQTNQFHLKLTIKQKIYLNRLRKEKQLTSNKK